MPGRRSDKRFRLTEPTDGAVSVFRDVIVRRNGDEWIAISREPAVAGETLILDVLDVENGQVVHRFPLCVIESRPVIAGGEMRYRIRLRTGLLPPVLVEQQVKR